MIDFPYAAAMKSDKTVAPNALNEMYWNTPAPGMLNCLSK